jgi:hypothetical protein
MYALNRDFFGRFRDLRLPVSGTGTGIRRTGPLIDFFAIKNGD